MKQANLAKLTGALGLCKKAGKLIFGTPMICEGLAGKQKPFLVLIAGNASQNTAKRLHDRCEYYKTPWKTLPLSGADLAHAVGKTAELAAVGITDENFCRLIDGTLKEENNI